jgi:hypothetical protein
MSGALENLIPRHKHDTERVQALVDRGYPEIEPILPELLEWVQDMNWPVAQALAPLLAGIGLPLAPYIRVILSSDDHLWKYFVLSGVVRRSPALRAELRPELDRLSAHPTDDERREEVDEVAREILEEH